MFCRNRTVPVLAFLTSLASFPLLGADDTHFALKIGSLDNLSVLAPDGSQVAEVSLPTVARLVKVGNAAFVLSYGRDANGRLTAILAPAKSDAGDLHFTAGGKAIDASKADVTLTFAANHQSVEIDPGYVGTVDVDSHRLRSHLLSDDAPIATTDTTPAPVASTPAPVADAAPVASTPPAPNVADQVSTPAAPEIASSPATPQPSTPAPAPAASPSILPTAPPMLASQLTSALPPLNNDASNQSAPATPSTAPSRTEDTMAASTTAVTPAPSKPMKLYWSEPVTSPDGTAPQVALNEIKLVEVRGKGDVVVVLPGGEIQTGVEGMVVPSGSTVRTLDNSSAALFMGGVSSARMMPQCELVVTQTLQDSTRKIVLDLHRGAVFTRVGHRDGETESFQVHSAEGSADASKGEMMAFRGVLADLQGIKTTMRSGLVLNNQNLLAWNPAPAARGLISDVPLSNLGILTSIGPVASTYYYSVVNHLTINAVDIRPEIFTNNTGNAVPSESEPDAVLQDVMLVLQPFNVKLYNLLKVINAGTETSSELAFYQNLITLFFNKQAPNLISDLEHHPHGFARELNLDSAILYQDLLNFKIDSITSK
jgi:hypothetical protein